MRCATKTLSNSTSTSSGAVLCRRRRFPLFLFLLLNEWMKNITQSFVSLLFIWTPFYVFLCAFFFDIWFFWRSFEEVWSLNFWKFHIFLRRKRHKIKIAFVVVIARTLVVVRSAPAWFWIAKRVRSVVVSKRSSFEERSSSSRLLCWWRRVGGVGFFFVCACAFVDRRGKVNKSERKTSWALVRRVATRRKPTRRSRG